MDGIKASYQGDFNKIDNFLKKALDISESSLFDRIGKEGVEALAANTPKRSGLTADSWYYEIEKSDGKVEIVWKNTNKENDWAYVAILIQYGHGTRTGGYVKGIDYINPAMRPIFDKFEKQLWKEVESL